MEKKIIKITLPENKRIIAVSDIHAHCHYLEALLKKINFCKEDILFIIGDMIEKGPDSLKTLRYIMQLCKEYTVYPLIGNVDAWQVVLHDEQSEEAPNKMMEYIKVMKEWYGTCFFCEMCQELGIEINSSADIQLAKNAHSQHFKKEFDFLRSLPTLIETQELIFVHGGVPTTEPSKLEEYNLFDFLKFDDFVAKGLEFEKYVIVGHWPVTLLDNKIAQSNPVINDNQKIISVDGGCGIKDEGQLNALIIPSINNISFAYESYDDYKTGIAQADQEQSDNPINIRWIDRWITILEKGEEFTKIKHKQSGRVLEMPNKYIRNFTENAYCVDYTDYKLPVSKGDTLSIIDKIQKSTLVKKDGILGWYDGEIL